MARASLPVSVKGVSKVFGSVAALSGIDLEIAAGEFLTLLGPSGAGKSTLLTVLAGFEDPTEGRILVGGRDITALPPHRRNIGMVFQNYALFPHMSVAENVAYPLRRRGVRRAAARDRALAALDLVRLAAFADRRPAQLSGGEQQRVALARAIVFEPEILLMDEPLSALDTKLRETLQTEIRRLHDRLGITTIYVTHDQREALSLSDRVAVIDRGRIAQVGSPETVYNAPANAFVAGFVGESTILKVAISGGAAYLNGRPIHTPRISAGPGEALLVVRPERLSLCAAGAASPLAANLFHGTLGETVFEGGSVLAVIRMDDGQTIRLRRSGLGETLTGLPAKGSAVTLALRPEDTILIATETP